MAKRRALGMGLMAMGDVLSRLFEQQDRQKATRANQEADDARGAANAASAQQTKTADDILKDFLGKNPNTAQSYLGIEKAPGDVTGPVSKDIAGATSLNEAMTDASTVGRYRGEGGRTDAVSNFQGRPNPSKDGLTLPSRNIGSEARPEITTLLAEAKAKREALMAEAEASAPVEKVTSMGPDGSTKDTYVSKRKLAGQSVTSGLSSQRQGELEGIKATAAQPGKTAAEVANMKGTFGQRFMEESKIATMKAAVELDKVAKQAAMTGNKNAVASAKEATAGLLQMEEIIALATQINQVFPEGGIDTAAGIKNSISQLPYVGMTLGGLMNTASGAALSKLTGDKSIPGKINKLEGLRRAAAIAAIRAAGDTRPSNADVDGIISSIPGAFESAEATKSKAQTMRDTMTLIPNLVAAHPELVGDGKGKALIDMAMVEAQKLTKNRAFMGSPDSQKMPPQAPGKPPNPLQSAQEKLKLLKMGQTMKPAPSHGGGR